MTDKEREQYYINYLKNKKNARKHYKALPKLMRIYSRYESILQLKSE